ncbi:bifunctional diaminohydroxyphosphoribosylaminopyrimidine deaminase/5-amino-6-(5-phosphoribosylamino)uracil reductase RibD [Myxococcota bacterium]|nr:bifunctional diaminohydroxyphosphoribosylaminopyrimidine deaminase/5-amino-6-(5-phosphoribosylamino)uracil reductase RibD [Myxococcota bacterium]
MSALATRAPSRAEASERDLRMMRRALAAAARGDGLTHPNPSVGAVVFRGERVLGVGTTRPPGGAHAEIVAMDRARRRFGAAALRGASLAVTLEPCNFTGRTGPCTEALLEAGIARVVAGCRDPHRRVSGRGFARLRRAGVEVLAGVLEAECRDQHRGFLAVCELGRPWITLKLAATLDGRIATATGESRWITSPESRERVHRLRKASDAVMIGSGTALADDPELTARRGEHIVRAPVRIVVDGDLRVPASARLFEAPGETWIVCGRDARARAAAVEDGSSRSARRIEVARDPSGHVDLREALGKLAEAGLTTVLVEGGGELAAALLRAELVDEVHWFLAPRLIGGDGRAALGALALASLGQAISFDDLRVARSGPDLHLSGRVVRPNESPRTPRSRRRSGAKDRK